MGIISKGIRGILKITKKTFLGAEAYEDFLLVGGERLGKGATYQVISATQKDALEKVIDLLSDDQKKGFLLDKFYDDKSTTNFIQEQTKNGFKEALEADREDLREKMDKLLGDKYESGLTEKEIKKEMNKIGREFDDKQAVYMLKIEEYEEFDDGQEWDEHTSGTTILGTPKSSFVKGASYNSETQRMMMLTREGNKNHRYLLGNVPYGKWKVLRDYQGFVPHNGMGTYTIRNIKKKQQWKLLTF